MIMCYRDIYGRKSWQEVQLWRPKWERCWFSVFHLFFVVVVSFFSKGLFCSQWSFMHFKVELNSSKWERTPKSICFPRSKRWVHWRCCASAGSLHIPTRRPASLFWGTLQTRVHLGADFCKAFSSWCQCLSLPEVSLSCDARGCWWQGNRLFCCQQDPCGFCGTVPHLPKPLQGCSQHRALTRLHSTGDGQLRDLDGGCLHCSGSSRVHPVPTKKSLAGCRGAEQCALSRLSLKQ